METIEKGGTEEMNRKVIVNRVYKHFKGGLYIVEDIARHSETGKEMVVYRSLKDGKLWVRPVEMFLDIKNNDGVMVYRFLMTDLEGE